jgi:hypothetical protein
VTFSTAFLMTVGMRLTGWFTRAPEMLNANINRSLGIAIMIAVITLGVGASIRRMDVAELRSALLGAASVLLALPLSEAAIAQQWNVATTIISGLGMILLVAGVIVSLTIEANRVQSDA